MKNLPAHSATVLSMSLILALLGGCTATSRGQQVVDGSSHRAAGLTETVSFLIVLSQADGSPNTYPVRIRVRDASGALVVDLPVTETDARTFELRWSQASAPYQLEAAVEVRPGTEVGAFKRLDPKVRALCLGLPPLEILCNFSLTDR